MAQVQFNEPERYELAALVALPLGGVLHPEELRIAGVSPALASLLARAGRGEPTVLPQRWQWGDEWLVVGATRRDLDRTLIAAGRFVAPTYVEHTQGSPTLVVFDPQSSTLDRLGAQLYSKEHYRWRSPGHLFDRVLDRLGRWADLEQRRPALYTAPSPSYRDLIERFSAALAAASWPEAERALMGLRQHSLTGADNLSFLEIQLLAQQRLWSDIWQRPDFHDIARLRSPRALRAALLTAAHHSNLLTLEQQGSLAEALEVFSSIRPRLGGLLEGLPDISYGPAARMFAYAAVAGSDSAALEALLGLPVDEESLAVIGALAQMLDRPATPLRPPHAGLDPRKGLRSALAEGDYIGALAYAQQLEEAAERIAAALDIAFLSSDPPLIDEALLLFWALPAEAQQTLQRNNRRIGQLVEWLSGERPASSRSLDTDLPHTWLDWLAAAAADPEDHRLAKSLDFVISATDDRYWNIERLRLLGNHLLDLASSGETHWRGALRDAVGNLRSHFLQDLEFPRAGSAYRDIYEALYVITLEQREINEVTSQTLLRLAEARLRLSPAARGTIAQHLLGWFSDPFPALKNVAQDALELLADYGVQGPALIVWYRLWAEMLLSTPRARDRLDIEGWLALGEWVQPGADLLGRLRDRLSTVPAADDPVAALLPGYQIAIFTLRPESAARVSEALRRRNPLIQVKICTDTVLTDQARSLAQSAALPVVVTTCVTHALTYGIGPHLREPVYPASGGSTSILRAIEERLRSKL